MKDFFKALFNELAVHGKMLVGTNFSAGEFGHVKAGDQRRPCQCGAVDCLETYCGMSALIADIQKLRPLLEKRGYSLADITGIFYGNWLRFFNETLPE